MALIENEEGADRVETILRQEQALLPFIVGLETYYVTLQERSEDEAERRLALLHQLPASWLDHMTDDVLRSAGRFKAQHRMSLADAIVAGFASSAGAVLVHKDPEFETIASAVQLEPLPYKRPGR
jgi:predicted nucleic acid-binding protein